MFFYNFKLFRGLRFLKILPLFKYVICLEIVNFISLDFISDLELPGSGSEMIF
jgi:hypothetical protein